MKKTIEIKKLGINGEGIGYLNRKIVFVSGALPGEEVVVEIVKQNRGYSEGKLVKILKASKNRVEPMCPLYENCQGCNMMHMTYESQLQEKKEAVKETLKKYTEYDLKSVDFSDVIASKQSTGYVCEVNLPIVSFNDKITFGIYQRESKYLTLMTGCLMHHPLVNHCLKELKNILTKNKCRIYNDRFKTGLRFLKLKLIEDKIQLVFVTGRDGLSDNLVKQISEIPNVAGIFMAVNTSKYQNFDESKYSKLYGLSRLELHHDNKRYLLGVKTELNKSVDLIFKENEIVKEMICDSKKIIATNVKAALLELNLDQEEIIALDNKTYQVEDAKLNAKYLKRDNVKFVAGKIEDKIVTYAKKKCYDTLIIHDSGKKLSEKIINTIKIARFDTVIYISDSYSALAKDIALLQNSYSLKQVVPIDTSCHNTYLTTIVKLVRKK
ncbi:23S rRNA (uracil(1939)-C(5))-methyltransferase RlmD [Thomasclavelia sp.]|uniref:23S rRNA (uracil(1939)-C(5))-methyltransferase RlmD n=1 Tax=Thomasclavelia sp. TaxID=3025757 RepID=UPI0025EB1C4E|nr:23S rRNA (uracil(1939)-C(5))-methyltransferase RlmD [Thomasclavelia sp.]